MFVHFSGKVWQSAFSAEKRSRENFLLFMNSVRGSIKQSSVPRGRLSTPHPDMEGRPQQINTHILSVMSLFWHPKVASVRSMVGWVWKGGESSAVAFTVSWTQTNWRPMGNFGLAPLSGNGFFCKLEFILPSFVTHFAPVVMYGHFVIGQIGVSSSARLTFH